MQHMGTKGAQFQKCWAKGGLWQKSTFDCGVMMDVFDTLSVNHS